MLIQSDFRDYYDSYSNRLGVDKDLVFHRVARKEPIKVTTEEWKRIEPYMRSGRSCSKGTNTKYISEIDFGLIFFCGKMYPFAHIKEKEETGEIKHTAYGPVEVIKVTERWDYKNPYQYFKEQVWDTRLQRAAYAQEDNFSIELNKKYSPILCFEFGEPYRNKLYQRDNAQLERYHFPLSVHEVSVELRAFIQYRDPEIVEVADKYKVLGHGFNEESFRTPPGGPTRKRKKIKPQ